MKVLIIFMSLGVIRYFSFASTFSVCLNPMNALLKKKNLLKP